MKKKNMALYIDGENIPAKKSSRILEEVKSMGELDRAKVYGIKDDPRTKGWSRKSAGISGLEDIRLEGGPGKDKVDRRIQKDIERDIKQNKNIDIIVIVSSDHGYAACVKSARAKGKRVVVMGGNQISEKLKDSCNKCINLFHDDHGRK